MAATRTLTISVVSSNGKWFDHRAKFPLTSSCIVPCNRNRDTTYAKHNKKNNSIHTYKRVGICARSTTALHTHTYIHTDAHLAKKMTRNECNKRMNKLTLRICCILFMDKYAGNISTLLIVIKWRTRILFSLRTHTINYVMLTCIHVM